MGKVTARVDEHACRVNYLFQAGEMVAKCTPQLSQYYGNALSVITEKTVPKRDFTMKRFMCKKCFAILRIGDNASYRLRKNKRCKGTPNMIITCLSCGEFKRIPTRRNYCLFADNNGKIIDSNGKVFQTIKEKIGLNVNQREADDVPSSSQSCRESEPSNPSTDADIIPSPMITEEVERA